MAETYIVGETKVRPGAYFNIQKTGNNAAASIISGVTAVIFKSDFGPLNQAVELNAEDGYADTFGTGGTTDAMQEAINGGAKTIIACRVGNGGTPATITLNDSEGEAAVTVTALYPGKKAFTATIREKLSDSTLKECIIFSGTTEFEKVEFTAGDGEAAALVAALSASKKFNTNMFIAIAIAGLMLHPDFRTMMEAVTVGDTAAHFLGIPVVGVKYTYTVIPALCMTWILSYIERAIDKITPAVTKNFLKPMLIFLVAAPIAIIVVGPVGIMIGEGISAFVYFVQAKLGFLAVGIMGALWPLLVITGMHRVFTPTILQTISETGMEGTVMPSEIGANLSLGGVSLAVAFKTKNSELRQTALAAASSALIAGTTEPALYGVAVRLKRPLIASLITGFVCGCLAGMAGLASRSMVSPSVLTGVQFIDPANPGVSIAWIAGISVLSIVLSFVLTLVIGFEDLPEEE